jgi:hypothetical protein
VVTVADLETGEVVEETVAEVTGAGPESEEVDLIEYEARVKIIKCNWEEACRLTQRFPQETLWRMRWNTRFDNADFNRSTKSTHPVLGTSST